MDARFGDVERLFLFDERQGRCGQVRMRSGERCGVFDLSSAAASCAAARTGTARSTIFIHTDFNLKHTQVKGITSLTNTKNAKHSQTCYFVGPQSFFIYYCIRGVYQDYQTIKVVVFARIRPSCLSLSGL